MIRIPNLPFDTSNTNINTNTIVDKRKGARDAGASRALGRFFYTSYFFLLY